jgi:hypothetical protein
MTHPIRRGSVAAFVYLTLSGPLLAAQPPVTETGNPSSTATVTGASAAAACRDDLKGFVSQMVKDGYWHPSDGNGFGYPMGGGGIGIYGAGASQDHSGVAARGVYAASTMFGRDTTYRFSSAPPKSWQGTGSNSPARTCCP